METQSGDKSLTHNSSLNLCSGAIGLNQNSSNTFYPIIQDAHFKINTSKERGVEVSNPNAEYYQDISRYSSLSSQKFLREYNLTNNIPTNFSTISFSPSSTEPDRTINITSQRQIEKMDLSHRISSMRIPVIQSQAIPSSQRQAIISIKHSC